ncbi:MAG: acyl carrier protein [Anaerolineales bacterium]
MAEPTDRVRNIIARTLKVDADRVVSSARFIEDLGADSLDRFELIIQLQDEFGVEITDKEAAGIETVAEAMAVLQAKSSGN